MSIKKLRPSTRETNVSQDYDSALVKLGSVNAIIDQANAIIDDINAELEELEKAITGYDSAVFQFTVKTDNTGSTATNQFKIDLDRNFKYLFKVEWGDGSFDNINTFDSPKLTHTYASAGTYTIKIKGTADSIKFTSNPQKVLEIQNWGMLYLQPSNFSGCRNLTVTATDVPAYGDDLSFVFFDCTLMTDIPGIGAWDMSSVKNVSGMFNQCYLFNGDVTTWNTSSITNMSELFRNARVFNQDISGWDTSSVTNMRRMFSYTYVFNQPIGNWNTSNVRNMVEMFNEARLFDQDIDTKTVNAGLPNEYVAWDVSKVTDMSGMFFYGRVFNQSLRNWDTSNVKSMFYMFIRSYLFNGDITTWNTGKVRNMSQMFKDTPFNQDISGWDVSSVSRMDNMFENNRVFDQPIGTWNTSSLNNAESMFRGATAFNQDIGGWDVSKMGLRDLSGNVQGFTDMFRGATLFNNGGSDSIKNWDVRNGKSLANMFYAATSFNQPIGTWDISNTTSLSGFLRSATAFNQDISDWNVSNVRSLSLFLNGNTVMNTSYIDSIYDKWSKIPLNVNLSLDLGGNTYTVVGEAGRNKLTADFGWTIVDGGLV